MRNMPFVLNVDFFACVQVPDGATVALVPRLTKHIHRENQDYIPGESEFDVLFS